MDAKVFQQIYSEIKGSIANAKQDVKLLDVNNSEGKQAIGKIVDEFDAMEIRFQKELDLLQQNAEWDKFTIAFFGETNAGKSTIIESLRILFNEESRQALLLKNGNDVAQFGEALAKHADEVKEAFAQEYTNQRKNWLASLQPEFASIRCIAQAESAARLLVVENESASRLRIAQEESSARTKLRLWQFSGIWFIAGSCLASVIFWLVR